MVTRSVAKRYAWGNCNPRLGRRTQTISRRQERSGSAFFVGKPRMLRHPLGNKDVEEGIHVGVTGTLTFSAPVGCLVGAQPLPIFVRVIQKERVRVQ